MTKLTPEEVNDSYELSIAKRLLRQKFPWVQDVTISDRNDVNEYHLIFVDVDVDGEKFLEENPEASVFPYYFPYYKKDEIPRHSFLTIFFDDIDARDIENDIDNIFKKVHKSPAIPDELKLPSDRRLAVSGFRVDPTKQSPSFLRHAEEQYNNTLRDKH
jgi:hypothetical protein